MLEYKICKKKNTIMLVLITLITVSLIVLCFVILANFQRSIGVALFILAGELFVIYKTILEFKASIIITENGIVYHRGNINDNFAWHHIRRLERSGLPFGAFGEMMVIHTSRGKIYIDYNIENYLEAWKQVIELGKEKNPEIIIDKYLKERFLL